MSIIQYRKVGCDNCGKIKEMKHEGYPDRWFTIDITKWRSSSCGRSILDKTVCSQKCALQLLQNLKRIPTPKDGPTYIV